jgi:hypothetical protein
MESSRSRPPAQFRPVPVRLLWWRRMHTVIADLLSATLSPAALIGRTPGEQADIFSRPSRPSSPSRLCRHGMTT